MEEILVIFIEGAAEYIVISCLSGHDWVSLKDVRCIISSLAETMIEVTAHERSRVLFEVEAVDQRVVALVSVHAIRLVNVLISGRLWFFIESESAWDENVSSRLTEF